ncbi:caspase family protein [Pseudogemmobacter sonorensis]|uniref:caspase family protein n=1 Tax=Pseudogemmobacter sonorensis TaxID=2989681 RepID=UPI00368932DF
MKRSLAYALLALPLAWTLPARAEVHAVLIGVGEYLYLDADLQGPPHDVRLMAETLEIRGVSPMSMTILTTDPTDLPAGAATALPTRAGIMTALEQVAERAAPGDTVVFYFSGHGSQAPDLSGDEGGGYDEIFLPMDARNWVGEVGAVENAILDDELQVWAQSVLARDVALVGFIDACHSATGFRSTEGTGVARALDEGQLGIPADAVSYIPEVPVEQAGLSGDFVFLYSSQAEERSFEYPLGDTGIWHGEFTLRLSETLARAPEASWAQVLAATADAMVQGPARQVPDGEGTMLDRPVFGEGLAGQRHRIEEGSLRAGLLQGIAEGTELLLYADGAGGEALGVVRVASVTARGAVLEGEIPEAALWAEVSAAPPPRPLTLAAAVRADGADGHDYAGWLAALPEPGRKPDLVPILTEGTVALARADGVLDPEGPGSTPRVEVLAGETIAEALARTLAVAAHGLRLRETLAGAAGRGLSKAEAITMEIERREAGVLEDGSCGPAGAAQPHDPAQGVSGCDQIWLVLTNSSGKTQDVSVLYFGADFRVQPIWPQRGIANRLAPGESARVGFRITQDMPAGLEEIWVLAVPLSAEKGLRVDLTRLATPGEMRGGASGEDPLSIWLEGRLYEDEDTALRGFSMKPADLTMLRQIVRLGPGTQEPV